MTLRINTQSKDNTTQHVDNKQLGLRFYSEKHWLEAVSHFEKELENNPNDATVTNYLALAYDNLGDSKKARTILGEAIKVMPDFADTYRTLSLLLSRDGRILEAADNACKAVELDPSNRDSVNFLKKIRANICDLKPANKCKGNKHKVNHSPTQEDINSRLRRLKSALNKADSVPQKSKANLSLCMIVKNEEEYLRGCLESVKDIVDEIVIVDTGSIDTTVKIAKSYGAKVCSYPWNDSFADARNNAIEHATGEWILVLDADERLDENSKETLLNAIKNPAVDAYELLFYNHNRADSEADVFVHPTCRLYRNKPEYRYKGRVHEMIVPSIEAAEGTIKRLEAKVHHYGYQPEVMVKRNKHERYIRLLKADLAENPGDAHCLYNLAAAYSSYGDMKNALKYFDQASKLVNTKQDFYAAATFCGLVNTLCSLNDPETALAAAERAESMNIHHPQLCLCRGNALLLMKRYEEAIHWFKSALETGQNITITGDMAALGYKTYYGMASAYSALGDYTKAVQFGEKAVTENPNHALSHELLADSYLNLKQYNKCRTHIDRCLELDTDSPSAQMVMGKLHAAQDEVAAALDCFVKVLELDPSLVEAYAAAGDTLYSHGNYTGAANVYQNYLSVNPDSADGFISLGNCYRQMGVYDAAKIAYQQALKLWPESKEASGSLAGLEEMTAACQAA
ncbi:MAG: tetratricopeptide repeat protein [Armatimonadota bacterium]